MVKLVIFAECLGMEGIGEEVMFVEDGGIGKSEVSWWKRTSELLVFALSRT